jgi:DNA-binding protein Fis
MDTTNMADRTSPMLEFDGEYQRMPISFPSEIETHHESGNSLMDDRDFSTFLEDQLAGGTSSLYSDAMAWMERRLLVRVLCETNGNKSKACQILGITRGSLRHKIAQLGISIHQTVSVHKV